MVKRPTPSALGEGVRTVEEATRKGATVNEEVMSDYFDEEDDDREWKFELPGGIREAISRQLDGLLQNLPGRIGRGCLVGRSGAISRFEI